MLGAIVGDIVGSVYEHNNHRSKDFPLFTDRSHFTDDTILTIATAHALMTDFDFEAQFGYDTSTSVDELRETYQRFVSRTSD